MTKGDSIEAARWRKNEGRDVVVSVNAYAGHRLVDIREYYRTRDGKSGPTSRGVSVHVEHLADLAAGLIRAAFRLADLEEGTDADLARAIPLRSCGVA